MQYIFVVIILAQDHSIHFKLINTLVTSMMNDKKRKEKFAFGGLENKRNAPLQNDLFKA